MIKILVATIFIGGVAYTPVYVLDSTVMPQLNNLKHSYENMDELAEDIAVSNKPIEDSVKFKEIQRSSQELTKPLAR